jgi:hypothetical protein
MTLDIRGYWEWLNGFVYNSTTAGDTGLSTKLPLVLAANPNAGMFSTNYGHIAANAFQVAAYDNDDRKAMAVMKELIGKGMITTKARCVGGFYQDRIFWYNEVPTIKAYTFSLSDPTQEVRGTGGEIVRPWEVLPGRWLFFPDAMIGRTEDVDLKDDPRALFIESVTYTMPYDLLVNGEKVGTLAQKLAQKGLGGLG